MVEYQKKASSGVAKTALGLGIGALGLQTLGGGLPMLNGGSPVAFSGGGGYVTGRDLGLVHELSSKDATIAKLEAEKYTDNRVTLLVAELGQLKADLAMETERRACGDRNLQTYVDGNYIKAEKSLNSRDINYHGCRPVIEPVHCCCEENP